MISSGVVTTLAGTGSTGFLDGDGTAAGFNQPNGITTDGTNLYVTDRFNYTIRQIGIASPNTVTTLAGTAGTIGSADGTGARRVLQRTVWHNDRRNEPLCDGLYQQLTPQDRLTGRASHNGKSALPHGECGLSVSFEELSKPASCNNDFGLFYGYSPYLYQYPSSLTRSRFLSASV